MLALVVVAAIAAWAIVRHAPEGSAEAETAPLRAQEIQSISLDGRGLPMAVLRDVLTAHAGDLLDAQRLDHDRTALQAALEARGYLAARVQPATVTFAPTGGAYVTFSIDQGSPFHLRNVTLTGASERDVVVTIASGDLAVAERIERARQAVADSLPLRASKATVTVKLHTEVAASAVDVELVVR
ncbi:MAG TPA: POTRA domain-containing protein [Kofleriaceae bacterium]|nr:POTRA domain-containing protein [Kofleriaceae bacterium]